MINIAIFISGKGSNATRMIETFAEHNRIKVACLISSKPNQEVSALCKKSDIDFIETNWALDEELILSVLRRHSVEWLVLAGFLKKIPGAMIQDFPNRIINIHPSLLPKFGGKGMYGMHVHKAVIEAREKESGISIHYVNEEYDQGQIIEQVKFKIADGEDAESLFHRIRKLEAKHFNRIVESEILKKG